MATVMSLAVCHIGTGTRQVATATRDGRRKSITVIITAGQSAVGARRLALGETMTCSWESDYPRTALFVELFNVYFVPPASLLGTARVTDWAPFPPH